MPETDKTPEICAVATRFSLPGGGDPPPASGNAAQVSQHMVRLLMAGARRQGFWSAEMIPPGHRNQATEGEWRLVERFCSRDHAADWHQSEARKKLVDELKNDLSHARIEIFDEVTSDGDGEVATAIVTDVRPGMEEEYFAWEAKIQSAQAKFPGYRGLYLQPPGPGRQRLWATLLRFDSPESLESWFASEERQALLLEAEKFVKHKQFRQVSSSFPGWIPTDAGGNSPPNWKTAMLVLLGLVPIVLLELRFLVPMLQALQPVLRTFISMVGSVAAISYLMMPLCIKTFRWWLFPAAGEEWKSNLSGIALLLLLYGLEILIFWN